MLLSSPLLFPPQVDSLPDVSFTHRNNTLYLGAAVVGGTLNTTDSPAQCAQRCSELLLCATWAWCPTDATTGCEIVAFADFVSEGILGRVKPSTCLASLDANSTFRASLVMVGPGVKWSSGYLLPIAGPAPSPPTSPPVITTPTPSPSPAAGELGRLGAGGAVPLLLKADPSSGLRPVSGSCFLREGLR